MRYGGNYKSYGPQYVRGLEAGAQAPDNNAWITYSMNKEDIWVSKIPIPVKDKVDADVNDDFSNSPPDNTALQQWNIYSALWASAAMESIACNQVLVLRDKDPFDYAKAERVVPVAKKMSAVISIIPQQDDHGTLHIEFQDAKGNAGIRLVFDSSGALLAKAGYRYKSLMKYKAGEKYDIKVSLNTDARFYTVTVNDKAVGGGNIFFAPLANVQRIVFRTGEVRRFPDTDTPTDQMYDLKNTGAEDKLAIWGILSLKTNRE
jgi:hypothetical protein